jgi:hypothetical protein
LTAGAWVAVWETWPALQPERATTAASAQTTRPEVRNPKRFTQASCI